MPSRVAPAVKYGGVVINTSGLVAEKHVDLLVEAIKDFDVDHVFVWHPPLGPCPWGGGGSLAPFLCRLSPGVFSQTSADFGHWEGGLVVPLRGRHRVIAGGECREKRTNGQNVCHFAFWGPWFNTDRPQNPPVPLGGGEAVCEGEGRWSPQKEGGGGRGHLGLTHTGTQRGTLWTA